jgi:hypothetical protein
MRHGCNEQCRRFVGEPPKNFLNGSRPLLGDARQDNLFKHAKMAMSAAAMNSQQSLPISDALLG